MYKVLEVLFVMILALPLYVYSLLACLITRKITFRFGSIYYYTKGYFGAVIRHLKEKKD